MLRVVFLVSLIAVGQPTIAANIFPNGTIWGVGATFIQPSDPSEFQSLSYHGRASKRMFDRRVDHWIMNKAYIFNAKFSRGRSIEIHVHSDFQSPEKAQAEAMRYMHELGQLPTFLRRRVKSFSVLPGNELYGGGNDNVHVSSVRTNEYKAHGNLAEVLFHEAAHATLDPKYGKSSKWRKAQRMDGVFISKYAEDFPKREDIAEMSLVAYAIIFHPNRVPKGMREQVEREMPNRMAFFREIFSK